MAKEFTVADVDIDTITEALIEAGANDKGEKFVLYPGSVINDGQVIRKNHGGIIRLEDEKGGGYEVGMIIPPMGNFGRPALVLTSFNSCSILIGRVLTIVAIKRW
jgi:hypothetical protein